MFHDFKACSGGVKGVGGNPVSILGKRSCHITLQSDDGLSDSIKMKDKVYVRTSLLNLLPRQLLVETLKNTIKKWNGSSTTTPSMYLNTL